MKQISSFEVLSVQQDIQSNRHLVCHYFVKQTIVVIYQPYSLYPYFVELLK